MVAQVAVAQEEDTFLAQLLQPQELQIAAVVAAVVVLIMVLR
jgi:hypothetical protein